MSAALFLAKTAYIRGEVPVGAVIVKNNRIVSTGFNRREERHSPIEHAEITAIRRASSRLGNWRLQGCKIFVTLEPCIMCAGALWQSRIDEVIFGATDPKGGALGGTIDILEAKGLNHYFLSRKGLLQQESSELLKNFFRSRRGK